MKKFLAFLLAAVLLVGVLAGCGKTEAPAVAPATDAPDASAPAAEEVKPETEASEPAAVAPITVSFATGGNGGAYYVLGGGMASVIEKSIPGSKAIVEATAASTENARLVGTKQSQFGWNMPDGAYFATTGEREFAATGEKYENLRSVFSGHSSVLQAFVLKSSGITDISQLAGKTVALSAPSSPSMYIAMACLEAYGLNEGDYEAVYMSYSEMGEAVRNGTIDCGFSFSGVPNPAATEITNTVDCVMLGMDEAKADAILEKYPYFGKATIPANTFKGQTEDILQLKSPAVLITYAELDEETVYQVTKAIWENLDGIIAVHASAKEWSLDTCLDNLGVELHPGAARYYREIGIMD